MEKINTLYFTNKTNNIRVELTEDEKDSIMNNLREQANTWVDCQVKIMNMRLKKLNMRLEIGIRVWLKRANRYEKKIVKILLKFASNYLC